MLIIKVSGRCLLWDSDRVYLNNRFKNSTTKNSVENSVEIPFSQKTCDISHIPFHICGTDGLLDDIIHFVFSNSLESGGGDGEGELLSPADDVTYDHLMNEWSITASADPNDDLSSVSRLY